MKSICFFFLLMLSFFFHVRLMQMLQYWAFSNEVSSLLAVEASLMIFFLEAFITTFLTQKLPVLSCQILKLVGKHSHLLSRILIRLSIRWFIFRFNNFKSFWWLPFRWQSNRFNLLSRFMLIQTHLMNFERAYKIFNT